MTNQFRFVKHGCYILGLTILFCINSHGVAAAETDGEKLHRPNIIFIFVDDQGYYDLSCYGATEVETPRIDTLAR